MNIRWARQLARIYEKGAKANEAGEPLSACPYRGLGNLEGNETMATVYRIHPQKADLHGIETEASDGTAAGGVHVFRSLPEVAACREWLTEEGVELVTIECGEADLREHGDYEGTTLLAGRGRIVERRPFADTRAVAEWVEGQI